jgi:ABC-type polar amino acid transport system ATPase subunit
MVANASRIVTVDLIDEITVTADPILATTVGIDVITAAMTDATTTVVMTALISVIEDVTPQVSN